MKERIITERQAIMQIDPVKIEHYMRDHVEPEQLSESGEHVVIARGIVGSNGGRVSGSACFSSTSAIALEGNDVILIKDDCTVADVPAIKGALGVLTKFGSTASETAILCRGVGRACLVLVTPLHFEYDEENRVVAAVFGKYKIREGDSIFVDSEKGEICIGYQRPGFATSDPDLCSVLKWADDIRRTNIYCDAESCAEATFGINCGKLLETFDETYHYF